MSKLKEVETFAQEMVKTFKTHSNIVAVRSDVSSDEGVTQSYVSDEGLSSLADIFGTVPIGLRPAVYSQFLDKLTAEGIGYDITQFGGTVH